MQSISLSIEQKYRREYHFHTESDFSLSIVFRVIHSALWRNYPWTFGWVVSWLQAIMNRHSSSYGVSSMEKLLTKTLPAFFLYLFLVFPSTLCLVMRVRRHVIINANTQFLLCARHPAFQSRKRKGNVGRESTLAETMPDERSYSHIREYNRAYLDVPRNLRLSWLREWRNNDQWFSSKCPCNCESKAARSLIELIRITVEERYLCWISRYYCRRMIDD